MIDERLFYEMLIVVAGMAAGLLIGVVGTANRKEEDKY
jgi:hypothetical protein